MFYVHLKHFIDIQHNIVFCVCLCVHMLSGYFVKPTIRYVFFNVDRRTVAKTGLFNICLIICITGCTNMGNTMLSNVEQDLLHHPWNQITTILYGGVYVAQFSVFFVVLKFCVTLFLFFLAKASTFFWYLSTLFLYRN